MQREGEMEISVEDYTKRIKNRTILDHVSVRLTGGLIYGFRGINGSGKTMLMRAICGMIRPTSGKVGVDGKVVRPTRAYPISVGALIENPSFLRECNGLDNLKMLASLSGIANESDIRSVLADLGLDPDDKRLFKEYSLGMRQKLGVAAAIMGKPHLIILDEPINALDEVSVEKVKEILLRLRANDRIIIIACHDREEMDYLADRIYVIDEGRIVGEGNDQETSNDSI